MSFDAISTFIKTKPFRLNTGIPIAPIPAQAAIAAFGNNSAGFGDTSTPFGGAGDFQGRTSAYAFTVTIDDPTATAIPEPASIIGTAIAGCAAIGLKRKLAKNK